MRTAKQEFFDGVRVELPIAVGAVPFGLIYGVLAVNAGMSPLLAQATSSILFAGSAQFILTGLVASATPAIVIWVTVFVVNLRHLLYSASLAPHARHLSTPWRWLLSYLLTDEAYVVTAVSYEEDGKEDRPNKHFYWFGAGFTMWFNWQIWTAVGIFAGTSVPESWSLDFTMALAFIGMVVPLLKNRPMIAAALSAGITAVLGNELPYKLGLMMAAIVGIAVGMLLESMHTKEAKAA